MAKMLDRALGLLRKAALLALRARWGTQCTPTGLDQMCRKGPVSVLLAKPCS
jgi:hypothetical protein